MTLRLGLLTITTSTNKSETNTNEANVKTWENKREECENEDYIANRIPSGLTRTCGIGVCIEKETSGLIIQVGVVAHTRASEDRVAFTSAVEKPVYFVADFRGEVVILGIWHALDVVGNCFTVVAYSAFSVLLALYYYLTCKFNFINYIL